MPYRISREHFMSLAEQELRELPAEFSDYLTNITIQVEDYPTGEDIRATGVRREHLLGMFRGIEYPQKGGFFDMPQTLPDRIVLFQGNIEDICSSEEELAEEIWLTLFHEIGHYFGMTEEELRRYES
jgi:predicted Zn-dependent protease with MMP-like domain